MTLGSFREHEGHLLLERAGGAVLFSTRIDVLSDAGADALARAVGVPLSDWSQDRQVHGAQIRVVRSRGQLSPLSGDFDGQVTDLRGIATMVRTADCVPVGLLSGDGVGMLHAGWRGLAAGVIEAGVAALREFGGSPIEAAIGPCARVCCYEVGDEVHAALAPLGDDLRAGRNADLAAAVIAALARSGVADVHDCGRCTICAPEGMLWSHRRDGTGSRNAGLAWRS